MNDASTLKELSPELQRVAERARQEPEGRFNSLAHLIDEEALKRSFHRLKKDAAVGVDGITKEQYGQELDDRIQDLHGRMKRMQYRHQPIRRVHIPKSSGKTRPIGISTTEDKIVQGALSEVLGAIYEQDFMECSYGFRPGRSAHDAVRALERATRGGRVSCILEADIRSFFDNLDRKQLQEMIQVRVPDGSMKRLIGKCLHVGVLDGEEFSSPGVGTTQGSVLSPLLGNIYLHHVLDAWFEREVRPRLKGQATLVRYADDFVIAFQRRDDAERVYEVLKQRMQRFGLTLHPEKTRLIPFDRPEGRDGKGPATFDYLGFTWYWRRTRQGYWTVWCKTRRERLTRAIKAANDFCRRHRHEPVRSQHKGLCQRLRGHYNYFGVNGNTRSLQKLRVLVERAWYRWLRRRSQRTRLTWQRFGDLLKVLPLPTPRVTVQIWGA